MKRRISTPYGGADPTEVIIQALGAVELDPAQVPAHWKASGKEFAIFLEGQNVQRPDWSRSEALTLVRTALGFRAWLERQRATAKRKGLPLPVSLPRWHGVAVCLICHELQIVQSNQTGGDLCWACQGRCRVKHRSNARACDKCRSEMQVIWTTDQDIPGDWT